jgi:hypothetical protein
MFTGIEGYTSLMGADEDRAFEVLHQNRDITPNQSSSSKECSKKQNE